MFFGINTFLFTSPFSTKDLNLFPQFKAWGFDAVEMAIEDPKHLDLPLAKRAFLDNGLRCGSISGAWGPGRDLRGSEEEQAASKSYSLNMLELCAELECPMLIGPLYSAVGRANAENVEEKKRQQEWVIRHLREITSRAETLGVAVGMEPLNRYETDFLNTCDQALDLIEQVGSSHLKILLDTFHMNIEEKKLPEAIRKAGKHLGHIHACGSDRGRPGNDHMDWIGIFEALKGINYEGGVVIESFTPEVEIIARAASIWREIEPSKESIAREGLAFLKSLVQ